MLNYLKYVTKENYKENLMQVADKLGEKFLKKGFEEYKDIKDP